MLLEARAVWNGGRTGRPLELKSRDALNSLQRCLVPDLRQRLGAVDGRSVSAGISLALRLSTLISHSFKLSLFVSDFQFHYLLFYFLKCFGSTL
uniref:Uncharacterized protein n=1 Tax=Fagus sylvatica TaxID=28930 RepID=A0A2N9EQ14_FAGSY